MVELLRGGLIPSVWIRTSAGNGRSLSRGGRAGALSSQAGAPRAGRPAGPAPGSGATVAPNAGHTPLFAVTIASNYLPSPAVRSAAIPRRTRASPVAFRAGIAGDSRCASRPDSHASTEPATLAGIAESGDPRKSASFRQVR